VTETLLEVRGLRAFYGGAPALHGIDVDVRAGEVVAVLGANGAGKTTLLRSISRTARTSGELLLGGRQLTRIGSDAVARLGVGHVPEGRGTFVDLTVDENLRLGALARRRAQRGESGRDLASVLELFPVLGEMRARRAGDLSGGQQQMLAIARALLGRPRLLLLDEPSLGLAPIVVREIFERLRELKDAWGLAILLAEQNVHRSLELADRGYVLETGQVIASGSARSLAADPAVRRAYMGE
jgi:branched-chain amino acid transport system ATP-binding protein